MIAIHPSLSIVKLFNYATCVSPIDHDVLTSNKPEIDHLKMTLNARRFSDNSIERIVQVINSATTKFVIDNTTKMNYDELLKITTSEGFTGFFYNFDDCTLDGKCMSTAFATVITLVFAFMSMIISCIFCGPPKH
jgi:hypothetical protein